MGKDIWCDINYYYPISINNKRINIIFFMKQTGYLTKKELKEYFSTYKKKD